MIRFSILCIRGAKSAEYVIQAIQLRFSTSWKLLGDGLVVRSLVGNVYLVSIDCSYFISRCACEYVSSRAQVYGFKQVGHLNASSLAVLCGCSISTILTSTRSRVDYRYFLAIYKASGCGSSTEVKVLFRFFFR